MTLPKHLLDSLREVLRTEWDAIRACDRLPKLTDRQFDGLLAQEAACARARAAAQKDKG